MMHDYWTYGGGYDIFGYVFMLFMMIIVVIGIIWAVRYLGHGGAGHGTESALDTLKKRYARGEISKDEFEQMKKDLQ